MAKKSDYFGLSYIVSLILAIIPVTAWALGVVTRFMEGKIVAGIIRIFGVNAVLAGCDGKAAICHCYAVLSGEAMLGCGDGVCTAGNGQFILGNDAVACGAGNC